MRAHRLIVIVLGLVLLVAPQAWAQQEESHWGVSGSFVPRWTVPSQLGDMFDASEFDIRGKELRIGIVRGRMDSGDWGVSFVHKPWRDGSIVREPDEGDGRPINFYLTRGVSITGIEVHKFVPFVTIRQRVQIGMTFAGGVAQFKGDIENHEYDLTFAFDPVNRRQVITGSREVVSMEAIKDNLGIGVLPLARIEVSVAVAVAPGLKVRAGGGLNLPGYQVGSVSVVYLFGAR